MTRHYTPEPIIEPDLPIIDAHHHLWFLPEAALSGMESVDTVFTRSLAPVFRKKARYLLDEYLADINSGHDIHGSVFVEAHTMYRADGPEHLKSAGEVEFANGVAAMSASGLFGKTKVAAGIVGGVDLRLGDAVEEVLHAQMRAGGDRYRGVRGAGILFDEDEAILGPGGADHVLADPAFRAGFKYLQRLGLSFDVLLFEPQLPQLIELARAFPETQIILNHVGVPVGVGQYSGRREERFPIWRENIRTLSGCANVVVKLGGFGIPFSGFESFAANPPASSEQIAAEWRPYVDTCVEAFGADRCMFVSNFPVDASIASYSTLWNAYKRLAAGASTEEKTALFSGTARNIYRLPA